MIFGQKVMDMLDAVAVLKDLVRFDTTNPPGNELPALRYVRDLLEGFGIETALQESCPGRGNLLARVAGQGGADTTPLVLLSHIDVVGADPGQWRYPPFTASEEQGYIYGRGTVDTKQLTVMELYALCALQKAERVPQRDVYLLVTCDEESGSSHGLQFFLDHPVVLGGQRLLGRQLLTGCDVISEGGGFPILVGEKQLYLCETGQKGCGTLVFTVKAKQGNGRFLPSGDGMRRAMALVRAIGGLRLEEKTLPTAERFRQRLCEAAGGGEDWQAGLSAPMRNILAAISRNIITVTLVEGNDIQEVRVVCDVRLVPGFGRAYLEENLRPICARFACEYELVSLGDGYESDCTGALPRCLEAATQQALGAEVELLPFLSMGSSDGRFLAPLGARVYGYSPVLAWDMTFDTAVGMVHGVDERIHADSVRFGCRVLADAVSRFAGVPKVT